MPKKIQRDPIVPSGFVSYVENRVHENGTLCTNLYAFPHAGSVVFFLYQYRGIFKSFILNMAMTRSKLDSTSSKKNATKTGSDDNEKHDCAKCGEGTSAGNTWVGDVTTVDCGITSSVLVGKKKSGPTYKISTYFTFVIFVLKIKLPKSYFNLQL